MAPMYLLVWKRPRPRSVREAVNLLAGLAGIEHDESLAQIDPAAAGVTGVEIDHDSDFPRDQLRSFIVTPGSNGVQELADFCVRSGYVLFDPMNQRLLVPSASRAQGGSIRAAAAELRALEQIPIVDSKLDPGSEDQIAAEQGYQVLRDLSSPLGLIQIPLTVPAELRFAIPTTTPVIRRTHARLSKLKRSLKDPSASTRRHALLELGGWQSSEALAAIEQVFRSDSAAAYEVALAAVGMAIASTADLDIPGRVADLVELARRSQDPLDHLAASVGVLASAIAAVRRNESWLIEATLAMALDLEEIGHERSRALAIRRAMHDAGSGLDGAGDSH